MKNIVGQRIKELRLKNNLTIAELSNEINLSAPAISNYERGLRSPDTDTLIELTNFFKCSANYLIGSDDYPDSKSLDNAIFDSNKLLGKLNAIENEEHRLHILESFMNILELYRRVIPVDSDALMKRIATISEEAISAIGTVTFIEEIEKTSTCLIEHDKHSLFHRYMMNDYIVDDDTIMNSVNAAYELRHILKQHLTTKLMDLLD